MREQLLGSTRGDHRHAARLLQAIASETPADVLGRGASSGRLDLAPAALPGELDPRLEPVPSDAGTPVAEPEPAALEPAPLEPEPNPPDLDTDMDTDMDADEPDFAAIPPLSSLPEGSPVWWWFSTGLTDPEPDPSAAPESRSEAELVAELGEALSEPVPLLLRERPPIPERRGTKPGDGPRLVILTSLTLRSGADEHVLELAGAGAVVIGVQPITHDRLRLYSTDAGAVPGFLAARPEAPGLAVVDVSRRDRGVEIEVELGPGWRLRGGTSTANGARVVFGRVLPAPPDAPTTTPE